MIKYDTKQQLPLFFVELEPNSNNKEIYKTRFLNTDISFEPSRKKRDIPQSMRCQAYGHTRNYCNRNPACVKCAGKHLTYNRSLEGKLGNAKCFNCQSNHPASYKGCIVRKQLQQKLYPPLKQRNVNNYTINTTQNVNSDLNNNNYLINSPQNLNSDLNNNNSNKQCNTSNENYTDALLSETKSLLSSQNNNTYNEISEIKQLLIQSAKSLELIRNMLIEQNKLFQQQIEQINAMIQLLTNVIANNNNKNG
ncbi:hypothetical protein HZH68_011725 [Vespula germanica]|uniref:Pre-C2HC domain-containing protein n=1 Tax=Vespula germanica TaxID=30212 RepID=A0A834N0P4_VESGE|nr:hypothetical protein HZH68_011725 [Vespula germanica]